MMATSSPGQDLTYDFLQHVYLQRLNDSEILQFLIANTDINILLHDEKLDDEIGAILIHFVSCAAREESTTARQQVLNLLQQVSDCPLLSNKGAKLLYNAKASSTQFHSYTCLLRDFMNILQKLNLIMPSLLVTTEKIGLVCLLKKQIQECHETNNDKTLTETIEELQCSVIRRRSELSESKIKENMTTCSEDNLPPPEDFRDLSVMPEETDLLYQTVFLRRNKVRGHYTNLHHYLDVQFRLYREDCIVPLRQAYEEFIQRDKENRDKRFRLDSGRIYRDVKVLQGTSTSLDHGEVFVMELDADHCNQIRWANSKRLIFGSILLLSFDRFRSVFFVLVSDSDAVTLMKSGCFKVQIIKTKANQKIPRGVKGILLEATSAYFEAYHHVLTALQTIKEDNLPFQEYVVYCRNLIEKPKYLAADTEPIYDIQPILSNDRICLASNNSKKHKRVKVLDTDNWPTKEDLGMDESQRKAFISAVTKEFVLIQGPPGTGKTYVGLQIAKALLHNKAKWKGNCINAKTKPCLLVVCYTNHALDQFVEGIINFLPIKRKGSFPEIVRVGSQCRNEKVDEYSIKNLRHKVKKKKRAHKVMEEANRTKNCIMKLRAILKIVQSQRVVLHFEKMSMFMQEYQKSMFYDRTETELCNYWFDWLNVSPNAWFENVQNKKSKHDRKLKSSRTKHTAIDPEKDENVLDIVTEAEYERNKRSLDDDEEIIVDIYTIGVDVSLQLDQILENIVDDEYQQLVMEEADVIKRELKSDTVPTKEMFEQKENLRGLKLEQRWQFYRYWLKKYVDFLKDQLQEREIAFNQIFEEYKKARADVDEEILNHASVIAVTTTGAARYHDSLMKIGPKITIIEEAAEVPEAHIVTAINPKCEHLILIGDHKQLEPKPAVLELATRYNLSTSLFERMINNGLDHCCLQRQHRMRPEISNLVRHMYDKLEDNENVYQYENIKGIRTNLYFITHEVMEDYSEDIKSFSNEHEAEFLKCLCSYLLKQGYKGSEITILAAYTGQMFLIRNKIRSRQFEEVKLSVLDNYQGEENDIILLSLVRSNEKGDIGFLKRENRICVALSRAKKGLYIIGNSRTLCKHSDEWKIIINKIKSTNQDNNVEDCRTVLSGSLGKALPLYCQNHPAKEGIFARLPQDFMKTPEGGCALSCEMRLDCGHVCRLKCHSYDKKHEFYVCGKLCRKNCPEQHTCEKRCHYPDSCACNVIMTRKLDCNHVINLECHKDPMEHECQVIVRRVLNCGHEIDLNCRENYQVYKCQEDISGNRDMCGHEFSRKCHDVDFASRTLCEKNVEKGFPDCNHKISVHCFVDISSKKCQVKIDKVLECGHIKTIQCFKSAEKSLYKFCEMKCEKKCDNSHSCEKNCHYPKMCQCKVQIEKTVPICGHTVLLECSRDVNNYSGCLENVNIVLDCGHTVWLFLAAKR